MNRTKDDEIEALREEIRALHRDKDQAQVSLGEIFLRYFEDRWNMNTNFCRKGS